jgi:hypothetical protein
LRWSLSAHADPIAWSRHAWKALLVLGMLSALVMCVLAVLKIVCTYLSERLNGLLGGYTQLEARGFEGIFV